MEYKVTVTGLTKAERRRLRRWVRRYDPHSDSGPAALRGGFRLVIVEGDRTDPHVFVRRAMLSVGRPFDYTLTEA